MAKAKIHIGKLIEEKVKESGMSVIEFAKKIGRTRNVVYNLFERDSIKSGQLDQISRILKHDFFKYYSERLHQEKGFDGTGNALNKK